MSSLLLKKKLLQRIIPQPDVSQSGATVAPQRGGCLTITTDFRASSANFLKEEFVVLNEA